MASLRLRRIAVAALACVCIEAAFGFAEPIDSIPNPRARDNTWVTDLPGMLSPAAIEQVNAALDRLESETGAEMAIVVIHSLEGMSIEEYAVRLFAEWGIGKQGRDNGVLFLWASDDRRVKIEVGYGLEGVLPDGMVGAVLDEYVVPRFRAGEYDVGVLEAVNVLAAAIREEPVDLSSPSEDSYDESVLPLEWVLGFLGLVPAGAASVAGVRFWRRRRPRPCADCGVKMQRLTETEDDALLDEAKQLEERLGSVDYDVWRCPSCSNHFTLRYPRWFTTYDKCPQCRNRTRHRSETTLRAATTSRTGEALVTEKCAFCNFSRRYKRTIPRVTSSSSGGGSSSSSGGSFGGGSSGGGGASRGY